MQQCVPGNRQAEDQQCGERQNDDGFAGSWMLSGEPQAEKGQQYQAGGWQNQRAEDLFEEEWHGDIGSGPIRLGIKNSCAYKLNF